MRAALYPGRARGGAPLPPVPQLSWCPASGVFCGRNLAKPAASAFSISLPGKEIVAFFRPKNRKYLLIFQHLLRLHRTTFYLAVPYDYA
jgi:hypothetical protein